MAVEHMVGADWRATPRQRRADIGVAIAAADAGRTDGTHVAAEGTVFGYFDMVSGKSLDNGSRRCGSHGTDRYVGLVFDGFGNCCRDGAFELVAF